ncbi:endonuclease NucS [Propionibacteriaceae bacterium Y1923]
MRVVIAQCQVDYAGRLSAHLPMATRLILVKADGSVSVHADDRAYKPLNWMSPPCTLVVRDPEPDEKATTADVDPWVTQVWVVTAASGDTLQISLGEIFHDSSHDLGIDPGLQKDGVEAHLQALLAENPSSVGEGYALVQREYQTPIGPVDLLLRNPEDAPVEVDLAGEPGGRYVAVEVKRKAGIDAVEQLTRYLELMNRDPLMAPVAGMLAAQSITKQARTLAEDRGIRCVLLDYDAMRGMDDSSNRLF